MTHLRCCFLGRKHYLYAGALQEYLVRQQLAHKAAVAAVSGVSARRGPRPPLSTTSSSSSSGDHGSSADDGAHGFATARPPPTLLLFESHPPVYTCGRRDMKSLPAELISYLRSPPASSTIASNKIITAASSPASIRDLDTKGEGDTGAAEFYESPRGGQITFHGAGQLTAYLICDLRAHRLTPRCHVRLLEHAVQATLRRYGLPTVLYEELPGVWAVKKDWREEGGEENLEERERSGEMPDTPSSERAPPFPATSASPTPPPPPNSRKIASVGVHVRRHVTSFGVAINARPNLAYFRRITACGLPGSLATSIFAEGGAEQPLRTEEIEGDDRAARLSVQENQGRKETGAQGPSVSTLAHVYANALAQKMEDVQEIRQVSEEELWDGGKVMQDWLDRAQISGRTTAGEAAEMQPPPLPTGSAMWKSR